MFNSGGKKMFFRPVVLWCLCFSTSALLLIDNALAQTTKSDAAPAEERSEVEGKLQEINSKMQKEQQRVAHLKRKQLELQESINVIKREAATLEEKKRSVQRDIQRLAGNIETYQLAIAKVEDNLVVKRDTLKERLVSIYKTKRRVGVISFLLNADSTTDMLKRVRYMRVVADHDRRSLDKLNDLVRRLDQKRQGLAVIVEERQQNLAEVDAVSAELEQKEFKQATLLRDLKSQQELTEKSLTRLNSAAQNLELILAKMMGGEPTIVTERSDAAERPEPSTGEKPTQTKPAPFSGKGLASLRGNLPPPVEGEIVQGYGKRRHDEFSDMLFSKGVEFFAPVGAKVKAVSTGRVIFNQVLSGYGNVVIVDHGQRYYTLYGRLASSLIRSGDLVRQGDVIAIVGEADERGRNFYFELRLKGKAVDPTSYLDKKRLEVA